MQIWSFIEIYYYYRKEEEKELLVEIICDVCFKKKLKPNFSDFNLS